MVTREWDRPETTCTKYIKTLSGASNRNRLTGRWVREWRFLQVKPLRRSFLLLIQDVFLGFLEIFVGDLHTALPQGHEAGFCADGLDDVERKEN